MKRSSTVCALAAAAIVAVGAPSFAASPGTMSGDQSQTPGTMPHQQNPSATMPDAQTQIPHSDSTRIVGQVVQIDREQGMVALATDEGMLLVQAPPHALQSIDVGDVVAIPRALAGSPGDNNSPSASPRMEPPSDQPSAPGAAPQDNAPGHGSPGASPHSSPDKL